VHPVVGALLQGEHGSSPRGPARRLHLSACRFRRRSRWRACRWHSPPHPCSRRRARI